MRTIAMACVGIWLGTAGAAVAQPASAGGAERYVGAVAQSSFGNVTSQAFGLEAGIAVSPSVGIFLEGGRAADTAPAALGRSAELFANSLGPSNVAYSVSEPVNFAAVGVRYTIAVSGKLVPYVLAGGGIGMVKPNAQFSINGTNINNSLAQYHAVLGPDLSGTTTKAMMVVGGGVRYPLGDRFYADAELRYNRVFVSGGIPFTRVGLGLGVTF